MALVGTATDQVLVDSILDLFQPAVKIDEIRATIQDATCTVIPNKVIFQGVLHKQIFFVRQPDNVVVHQAEDIPFSGFVDLIGATPNDTCELGFQIAFVDFHLLNSMQLRQKVLIDVAVAVPTTGITPVPVNGGAIPVPVNGGSSEVALVPGSVVLATQQQPTPVFVAGSKSRSRGRSSVLNTNPSRQSTGPVGGFKAVQKMPVSQFIARR